MSVELNRLEKKIATLENVTKSYITASNFIFHHIIETINTKYPESHFTDALKSSIEGDIARITDKPTHDLKKAINTLLQSPVQQMFQPKEDPFIK